MAKSRELVKTGCQRCGEEFFIARRTFEACEGRTYCSTYCKSFYERFGPAGLPTKMKNLSVLEHDPNRQGSVAWWRDREAERLKKQAADPLAVSASRATLV